MKLKNFTVFRFFLSSAAMTVVCLMLPRLAFAFTFHDPGHTSVSVQNLKELRKKNEFDADQLAKKEQEVKDAAQKLKDEQKKIEDEVEKIKTEKKGVSGLEADYVSYTMSDISKMHDSEKDKKTKLSPGAQKFFPNEYACRNDKPNFAKVTSLVLSVPMIQDKLEYNCIALRELKAMSVQAAFDYSKIAAKLKTYQKDDMTSLSLSEGATVTSARMQAAAHLQDQYASQYERVKEAISMQEQLLLIKQRDYEIEQVRGRKGAPDNLVSKVITDMVIGNVLKSDRAVNGNRQTARKPTYAD